MLRHPSGDTFIEAAVRNGIPRIEDLNAPPHEGVAYQQFSISDSRRHTAYDAFIKPVRHRRSLMVATDSMVLKVLFSGRQAAGIEVRPQGRHRAVAAAREVILRGAS